MRFISSLLLLFGAETARCLQALHAHQGDAGRDSFALRRQPAWLLHADILKPRSTSPSVSMVLLDGPRPALCVLDLDMCCWSPEMYEVCICATLHMFSAEVDLRDMPEKTTTGDLNGRGVGVTGVDSGGRTIRLFSGALAALQAIFPAIRIQRAEFGCDDSCYARYLATDVLHAWMLFSGSLRWEPRADAASRSFFGRHSARSKDWQGSYVSPATSNCLVPSAATLPFLVRLCRDHQVAFVQIVFALLSSCRAVVASFLHESA
eukprot:4488029-Pleurochrysis_carterae.AAC.3